MLPIIWEHISIFYIISVFVASICLVLTYFYSHGLDEPIVEEEDLKKNKPEDFLAERKPLRLAKKLEEKLPESVKNLEKKYTVINSKQGHHLFMY